MNWLLTPVEYRDCLGKERVENGKKYMRLEGDFEVVDLAALTEWCFDHGAERYLDGPVGIKPVCHFGRESHETCTIEMVGIVRINEKL